MAGTHGAVIAVVAAGGVVGACLRYGAALAWPTPQAAFPWTTWAVNTAGCAAIGVLMAVVAARRAVHPLVRPFLGTGVLGGFTTFSTYAVDAQRLLDAGRAGLALAYLAATMAAALAAVTVASAATRLTLRAGPQAARALFGRHR
ncbi:MULTISPECIES: CrcB family protein [unclassified Pseudofrankia]|uniref:fluoride efflux transporter FluC n=1 Tax=unclassified Pseudofrankia TaxID=2994372 RepID=UPI0008DAC4C5|nr:chromosome condensation protein CrcB [Pseudofrankia sp. BMG5.36]